MVTGVSVSVLSSPPVGLLGADGGALDLRLEIGGLEYDYFQGSKTSGGRPSGKGTVGSSVRRGVDPLLMSEGPQPSPR